MVCMYPSHEQGIESVRSTKYLHHISKESAMGLTDLEDPASLPSCRAQRGQARDNTQYPLQALPAIDGSAPSPIANRTALGD